MRPPNMINNRPMLPLFPNDIPNRFRRNTIKLGFQTNLLLIIVELDSTTN